MLKMQTTNLNPFEKRAILRGSGKFTAPVSIIDSPAGEELIYNTAGLTPISEATWETLTTLFQAARSAATAVIEARNNLITPTLISTDPEQIYITNDNQIKLIITPCHCGLRAAISNEQKTNGGATTHSVIQKIITIISETRSAAQIPCGKEALKETAGATAKAGPGIYEIIKTINTKQRKWNRIIPD
jgi:hypothetical protein